ncbi:MAG: rhamnogalacturonan acetylesterase [Bacteroidales bacterium]|nr:rhamnogalacturonan acetylesterase [Bacteroidales bacterium]
MKKLAILALMLLTTVAGAKKPSVRIHLVGDSFCSEYGPESRPQTGWGEMLGPALGGAKVFNYAIGGQSTKSFIDEGRWDAAIARVKPGDLLLMQFGGNDQKVNSPSRYVEAYGGFYDNLNRFIEETRAKGGVPVLVTSPSRRYFHSNGSPRRTLEDYPDAMRKLAADTNTPLVDAEEMTHEWLAKLGDEASKPYFMVRVNGTDNTHFTREGAEVVAGMIAKSLIEQGLWQKAQ